MDPNTNFFYSNLFIAIVTFIVGSFGLYIYWRRKRDLKKRIARIILLEIRNAEEQLKAARDWMDSNSSLPDHLYTMQTDTWKKNRHLFVGDFKPSEWNLINDFYELCHTYDEAIEHNDSRFAHQENEIRKNAHKASYKYAVEFGEKLSEAGSPEEENKIIEAFYKKREGVLRLLTNSEHIYIYTATKQLNDVKVCLKNANYTLSTSTVGDKFEKLSKSKWWLF